VEPWAHRVALSSWGHGLAAREAATSRAALLLPHLLLSRKNGDPWDEGIPAGRSGRAVQLPTNSREHLQGREQFEQFGFDPYGGASSDDVNFMDSMMSERHVVTHNLGVADRKFIERGGHGQPGHSIDIKAEDITRFLDLLERMIVRCETGIPEMTNWA